MPFSVLEVMFSGTIDRCLQLPFSSIVTDSEDGDRVAACVLSSVWKRTDTNEDADYAFKNFPENAQLFVNLLNSMHSNFWDLAPPNVQAVLHREIVSVGTPYMRKGISSRLVAEQLNKTLIKKHNIGGIISEATSLANQRLEEKHGFRCLLEKSYAIVVDSKGNCVLQLDDGTTHIKLNFKEIGGFENLPE
ncbi:hypothetical protein CRE_05721 [Caenorhabditis remanei]|uniref:aralkylamine N-acetyltransferase n=1 Tax=Caenorhabditis remanei TaxID=31234 RepID=E3LZP7_CAERE|nr:hypothetical protein CRE_05721 [Caenorhabditis remanei]